MARRRRPVRRPVELVPKSVNCDFGKHDLCHGVLMLWDYPVAGKWARCECACHGTAPRRGLTPDGARDGATRRTLSGRSDG